MTCDLCAKNEATVYLTEMIDDQTRELHLCEPCAREKGKETAKQFAALGAGEIPELLGGGLAELLAGLADFGTKVEGAGAKTQPACPRCGMAYEDFRRVGRLGCGNCYEAFRRYLAPLLKRIHGSTQHVGRTPAAVKPQAAAAASSPKEELGHLKQELKETIAAEDFEKAARLRDRVRALEARMKKGKSSG